MYYANWVLRVVVLWLCVVVVIFIERNNNSVSEGREPEFA